MKEVIDRFYGISPRFGDNLAKGWATVSTNVDLSTGKIRPRAAHRLVQAAGASSQYITRHAGQWYYGPNRFFAPWRYTDLEMMWFLDSGNLQRLVGTAQDNAGQARQAAPTVAVNVAAGNLDGDYRYFTVMVRNVGGYIDLSGPSTISAEISPAAQQADITIAAIADPDVTHWWLFRLSSNLGTWNFIAEIVAGTLNYTDNTADEDVGEGPTTYYTSQQGNQIILDEPPALDGIAQELYYEMLLGWNGTDIYTSEPLMPDLWNETYFAQKCPFRIMNIVPLSGFCAILTDHGPFRLDGSNPELLMVGKLLSTEPCTQGRASCPSQKGVFYLSDSGIALFDSVGTSIISDQEFMEEWFRDNVVPASSWMIYNDDHLYLGHSGGILVCDMRKSPWIWYELSTVATGAWLDPAGTLYLSTANGIEELHGLPYFMPSDLLPWTWRSGDFLFGTESRKKSWRVLVSGSGTLTVNVYVDGTLEGTKIIDLTAVDERARSLHLPRTWGRALQVELIGQLTTVDELTLEGYP